MEWQPLHVNYGTCQVRMQQFVKFVRRFLIRKCVALLWFASGFVREAPDTELQRFLPNALHFHGKKRRNPWIAALYKTAHCGAAIKVRRTWRGKNGAHGAMFPSAAAAHLLHSFYAYHIWVSPNQCSRLTYVLLYSLSTTLYAFLNKNSDLTYNRVGWHVY